MRERRIHNYKSFGLSIRSEIELPDLVPNSGREADVHILFRPLNDGMLDSILGKATTFSRPGCVIRAAPNAICYRWEDIGTALVRNGSEIAIELTRGVIESDIAPFVTGALMGNLLDQRRYFVLHGSGVLIDGKAVGFLGEKGDGKSTLALHFQMKGLPLLTDDLLSLTLKDGTIVTAPGFPRIRAFPDSVLSAGIDPASLPRFSKFVEKASFQCAGAGDVESPLLDRIYVLATDDEISITQLDPPTAFIELTRHTYLKRYLKATGKEADHFRHCGLLVSKVPIFRLARPRDLGLLPAVTDSVIHHHT
jgi:hypothetical protein